MKGLITVVTAESHFLTRLGLRQLVSRRQDLCLLEEVGSEVELMNCLKSKKPDVLLIDPFQPGFFSLETIQKVQLLSSLTKVMVISNDYRKSTVYRALETGVHSFLTKECDDIEIYDGISSITKGERFFCKKILNLIWEKSFGKTDCTGTPLTPREIEIVQRVACGKITKEIAYELSLSTHTVYTHRKNIMRKLNLNTTPELVLYAVNHGIVEAELLNRSEGRAN